MTLTLKVCNAYTDTVTDTHALATASEKTGEWSVTCIRHGQSMDTEDDTGSGGSP